MWRTSCRAQVSAGWRVSAALEGAAHGWLACCVGECLHAPTSHSNLPPRVWNAAAAQKHEERVRAAAEAQQSEEAAEEAAGTAPLAPGDAPTSAPVAVSSSSSSRRDAKEQVAAKVVQKLNSSKEFLDSHLMRASVLTPIDLDTDPAADPPAAAAARGSGGASSAAAAAQPPGGLESIASGVPVTNGAPPGGEEEEDDEEMHHAAGMGATAVSVVVRGNRVVIANTGAPCFGVLKKKEGLTSACRAGR